MVKKMNVVLKNVLESVESPKEELDFMNSYLNDFLKKIRAEIKRRKFDVSVFVGGSFAKGTVIKKDKYDVDIFLRFGKRHSGDDFTKLVEKILIKFKEKEKVHGSRDYFRIPVKDWFFLEIVPVKKVAKPEQADNITDLSYSHVQYVKKNFKDKKILDDIKIAKAFCHAKNVYGAESYIKGFSGYLLELLVFHYGSFEKFLSKLSESKEEKILIDIERFYKPRSRILIDINESKLDAPIVFIDPTCKNRNVAAALSSETFEKFKIAARKFLKSPSVKHFEREVIDLAKIKKQSRANGWEFVLLEACTDRQSGDIAGTKLLKFYEHLTFEIGRFFVVKKRGFNYNGAQNARFFFAVEKKRDSLLEGPKIADEKNVKKFEAKHVRTHKNYGRVYAHQKINFTLKEFLKKWKRKYSGKIKDMDVIGFRVV